MIEVGTREVQAEVAGAPPLVEVTFSIPDRPDIVVAAVLGDFNDWTATEMTRTDAGHSTTLWLERGRRHRFKYLLNGDQWENDWAADDYEPNPHGGDDSVVDLRHPDPGQSGGTAVDGTEERTLTFRDSPASPPQVNAMAPAFDRDRRAIAEFVGAWRGGRSGANGHEISSSRSLACASTSAPIVDRHRLLRPSSWWS